MSRFHPGANARVLCNQAGSANPAAVRNAMTMREIAPTGQVTRLTAQYWARDDAWR
jgi:hypothetical protein